MNVFSKTLVGVGLIVGFSSGASLAATPEATPAVEAPAEAASQEVIQDPSLAEHPGLVKVVEAYMTAWVAGDYEAMNRHEDWEGGEPLEGFRYMQTFNHDFGIGEWRVSRIIPEAEQEGRFRVLVWLTHNPPQHVSGYVPGGMKVRSTIPQFWKQDGDKFVHLFHVEKKTFNLKQSAPPAPTSLPAAAPETGTAK